MTSEDKLAASLWGKTKKQLIEEITALRQRVTEQESWAVNRQQTEEAYHALVDHSLQGLIIIQDGRIVFANRAFAKMSGYTVEELTSLLIEDLQVIIHPEDRALVLGRLQARMTGKDVPSRYTYRGFRKNGELRWLELFATRINYQGKTAVQVALIDITDRIQEKAEREKLVADLQTALTQVKQLSGLLPICARCKNIRDGEGYWHQVEVYIANHSEAQFSHGVCPDCIIKLYPEFR